MPKVKFLKEEYLEETPSLSGKHFEIEAKDFLKKIKKIKKSCIFGLVGDFGVGKSTMLNTMKSMVENTDIWINFDSWQYPERKELRDGFVLSVTDQILYSKSDEIKKLIDGKEEKNKIIEVIKNIPSIGFIGNIMDTIMSDNNLGIKRIDEYKKLLEGIIEKASMNREFTSGSDVNNTIYIVLEDVDRSGQEGIYFLETLNNFIKSLDINSINSKIICICPISKESLEKYFQKYLKVFDYYDFFTTKIDINLFIKRLFYKKILIPEVKRILEQVIGILIKDDPIYTIREIKFLLRLAYNSYKQTSYNLERLPYLTIQLYKWRKVVYSFSSNEEKERERKKGFKKMEFPVGSIFGQSVGNDRLLNSIILSFKVIDPSIPANISKFKVGEFNSTLSHEQDILTIPRYYFE